LNDSLNNALENSLRHQLKEIPDFEIIFNEVMKILKEIIG